jgi:hypothetical protein
VATPVQTGAGFSSAAWVENPTNQATAAVASRLRTEKSRRDMVMKRSAAQPSSRPEGVERKAALIAFNLEPESANLEPSTAWPCR